MLMKDIIKSWINAMLETISGKGLANTLVLELHIPVEISEDLNVIFLSVGSTLVCIYFTLALIDKVSSDNFNTDQFVKLLLKLVLAIAIIEHAGDFVSVIQSFAESFTQAIGDNAGVENGVQAQIGDMDLMEAILTLLLMILPFVAGLAANVVGLFMIFTYKIEFEIRKMLAPIGLADFMTGGPHSNGIRYLKGLIAMAMQGGLMILILNTAAGITATRMMSIFSTDLFANGVINGIITLVSPLAIQFAAIGLLGTTKSIAREIVG